MAPDALAASAYYVSPTGAGTTCSPDVPCALETGVGAAVAGDTVVLLDGTYKTPIDPPNSGSPNNWITFQAAQGALPIFDGSEEAQRDGGATTGLGSATATYLRFVGIVARNWSSGFSNGWTGTGTTSSNGHFQYIDCIADGNTRNGFVFNSATGILVQQCIVAHNGSSTTHSWSSGVQLFEVQGTPEDNVVEQNVSFENADMQNHTDGSGFIVDEMCTGASFIDNIAFRNGGSCIRMTKSQNTHLVNNTCYHNGLDPSDTGPTNPGEIYFTDAASRTGVVMVNNIAVASGSSADGMALVNAPTSGLTNNFSVNSGATPFFTDAAGTNPNFNLTSQASTSITDKGTGSNAPSTDIGFDPKCIKSGSPGGGISWAQYSVDYAYIKSVGGVAGCFHPGARPAGSGVDIGAYELNGKPVPVTPAPPLPPVGTGAMLPMDAGAGTVAAPDGGSAGTGGSSAGAGRADAAAGGDRGTGAGAAGADDGAVGAGTDGSSHGGSASGSSSGASGTGGSAGASASDSGAGSSTNGPGGAPPGRASGSSAGGAPAMSNHGGAAGGGASDASPGPNEPGEGNASSGSGMGGCSLAPGRGAEGAIAWVGIALAGALLGRRRRAARP